MPDHHCARIINVKINVALSENASRTRYTIKIKLKLRKWVLKKKKDGDETMMMVVMMMILLMTVSWGIPISSSCWLFSYGVFSPVESADMSLLVARLARNQMLLVCPSPVEHIQCPHSVISQSSDDGVGCRTTVLSQIHRHVIHNCIADTFPELLYAYLDFWRYLWFIFMHILQ